MTSTDTVVDLLQGGLRCGEAQHSGPLTLVPLFHRGASAPYRLFAEAFAAGWAVVEEVGVGTVPELVVANRGSDAVLLLEGEILGGLRQTRTLNTTVLVPPRTRLTIPVSCVEAGRWGGGTAHRARGVPRLAAGARGQEPGGAPGGAGRGRVPLRPGGGVA